MFEFCKVYHIEYSEYVILIIQFVQFYSKVEPTVILWIWLTGRSGLKIHHRVNLCRFRADNASNIQTAKLCQVLTNINIEKNCMYFLLLAPLLLQGASCNVL